MLINLTKLAKFWQNWQILQKFRRFLTNKFELWERCKGVHCVDLGESFPTHIFLQNLASIQRRKSLVKFARFPRTDRTGSGLWRVQLAVRSVIIRDLFAKEADTSKFAGLKVTEPLCVEISLKSKTKPRLKTEHRMCFQHRLRFDRDFVLIYLGLVVSGIHVSFELVSLWKRSRLEGTYEKSESCKTCCNSLLKNWVLEWHCAETFAFRRYQKSL